VSPRIPPDLTELVRQRAGNCCEYCRLPQEYQDAEFHIDHIKPRSAGGRTIAANLALACTSCSLRKSDRTSAIDQETRKSVRLFHPRADSWGKHFQLVESGEILGRTSTGRATAAALLLNQPRRVRGRRLLIALGIMHG
jgi:hypothetical protein